MHNLKCVALAVVASHAWRDQPPIWSMISAGHSMAQPVPKAVSERMDNAIRGPLLLQPLFKAADAEFIVTISRAVSWEGERGIGFVRDYPLGGPKRHANEWNDPRTARRLQSTPRMRSHDMRQTFLGVHPPSTNQRLRQVACPCLTEGQSTTANRRLLRDISPGST